MLILSFLKLKICNQIATIKCSCEMKNLVQQAR